MSLKYTKWQTSYVYSSGIKIQVWNKINYFKKVKEINEICKFWLTVLVNFLIHERLTL